MNKMYHKLFLLFSFIFIANCAYPKKIELSRFFIFEGKVDDSGKPKGNGKLELTYYFHHTSPLTGKEEDLVRKDVLEGDFSQGIVQSGKLLIERHNSPLWITSASFKGKIKYEFANDMSYIQYTLEEGVFKDSKFNKIVIMPGKPLIIKRTPSDTHCITQVMSPGFILTKEFELKETQESIPANPLNVQAKSDLSKRVPEPIQYNKSDLCKEIVDWVARSQKKQRYQQSSWPYAVETITKNLWNKAGSNYNSRKFSCGSRFAAARGFRENYFVPFEGLLHHPEGDFSFSLSKSVLTYSNKDQIQIQCETHPKTGKPVRPSDGATEAFGCKSGTRTATTQISLLGKPYKFKFSVSCNHNTYQSSYFNVVYSDGTPVNEDKDGHDVAINRNVRPNRTRIKRNDDYAPWRQIHTQSVKYNLDEIARLNKISKKELATLMILTPNWDMPLTSDKSKSEYHANWGEINLNDGQNIDHAVLIYFLWNQFGITEAYLNDYVKELENQRKDSIYRLVTPYISTSKSLLKNASTYFRIDEHNSLNSYKKCVTILLDTYTICLKAGITELIDSIRAIPKMHCVEQLYYASKYGIQTPEFDLSSCLNDIKNNPPKEGIFDFLSECRDYYFLNGNYDQVLLIANDLRPLIQNQTGIMNEERIFENYQKTICALLKKNMKNEAISIANEYISSTPSSVLPYETLCYIYAYQRDKKSAMAIWKNFLMKSDKKYAEKHPNSATCNLMKQLKWIK